MNTATTTTTRKMLLGLLAKESISVLQFLSVTPRNYIGRTKSTTTRCVHHRCAPASAYTATTRRTRTRRQKRSITNKYSLTSGTNSFAAFAIATVMTSTSMSPSSMATAFVPTPMGARTRVVQLDPSLIIQKASAATDGDNNNNNNNKLFFEKVEFETMDAICDMTSSVATTAATSSTSSFNSAEDYQYSLRNVLVSKKLRRDE